MLTGLTVKYMVLAEQSCAQFSGTAVRLADNKGCILIDKDSVLG